MSAVEVHKNFSDLIIEQERPDNYRLRSEKILQITERLGGQVCPPFVQQVYSIGFYLLLLCSAGLLCSLMCTP